MKSEKLKELGFQEEIEDGEIYLSIHLRRGQDRFNHFLRWYADEPENFYIDCVKNGGAETISEDEFLSNYNNFKNSAVQHYKEIMEKLND